MYDIIIVGAGPAGLTAAIYALRANKKVLLLEKGAFGGQMTYSPKIENYPGFESISGNELADKMVQQALDLGADAEPENVIEISDNGSFKTVLTEEGNNYTALSVIIASGAKHRRLGIENEDKFIGEGISFCAVCDGAFYEGKTVALIGGGNSALQEAVLLSDVCKKLYIVQNLAFLTGEKKLCDILEEKPNVEIIYSSVVDSIPSDTLNSVTIKNTETNELRTLDIDGMFVAIGLIPENENFKNIAMLDEPGYIISDERCTTNTNGVFAAGDCRTKSVRQVSTAIGDGASAAVAACRYIDNL